MLNCTPRKWKTDSANDQNPCSNKMRPLMFILFKKYNLIRKILTLFIKLRSNETDKIQQKESNYLIVEQQPLSRASKIIRFVFFF